MAKFNNVLSNYVPSLILECDIKICFIKAKK